MEKKFSNSLGTASKIITGLMILVGFLIPVLTISDRSIVQDEIWFIGIVPLFFLVLPGITFLYMPDSYTVSSEGIRIKRKVSDVLIPLNEIVVVKRVSKEEMWFPMRIFGNGGLFGFTGYYSSGKMGWMRWYATQRDNYVLISTSNGKKIIVTPDDPESMVQMANTLLNKSVAE